MERKHFITGERTTLEDWINRGKHLDSKEVEKIRKIKKWDDGKWELFPDAGAFQNTGLTSKITSGSSSAIWLKLKIIDPLMWPYSKK